MYFEKEKETEKRSFLYRFIKLSTISQVFHRTKLEILVMMDRGSNKDVKCLLQLILICHGIN